MNNPIPQKGECRYPAHYCDYYKGADYCNSPYCEKRGCHKAPEKEEHTHDFVFMHPTGKVMCIECGEPPPNDLTTPAPTQTLDTEKGIEVAFDLCNKIWNQNGKHTHAQLDELITMTLTSFEAKIRTDEADKCNDHIEKAVAEERTRLLELIKKQEEKLETEAEWLDTRLQKGDWEEEKYQETLAALNLDDEADITEQIGINLNWAEALSQVQDLLSPNK